MIVAARGLPLAATSLMPVMVSLEIVCRKMRERLVEARRARRYGA